MTVRTASAAQSTAVAPILRVRSLKSTVEADFASLPELIARAEQMPEYQEENSDDNSDKDNATQLSMF